MYDSAGQHRREEVRVLAEGLYRDRRAYLLAIARRNSDAGVDVEAAVQDAFLAFLEHYDPATAGSEPLPWLTLTLKRRCWALYGREKRARGQAEREAGEQATGAASPDPLRSLVHRERTRSGLARLKPAERRALSLLAFGYSYREICRLTGWSKRKLSRSIYEGRMVLRELTEASSA